MNAMKSTVWVALSLPLLAVHGQTFNVNDSNCSQENKSPAPANPQLGNSNDHTTGGHGYTSNIVKKCAYTGSASLYNQVACQGTSTSTPAVWPWENGVTWYTHHETPQLHAGSQTAIGAAATSNAETASGVWGCLLTSCSPFIITIGGTGQGAPFSVSFNSANTKPLEEDKSTDGIICPGYILNQMVNVCANPNPPYPPSGGTCGISGWQWSEPQCAWVCPSGASPLAVDTRGRDWEGEGFSDPAKGDYVTYDLGDGVARQVSWPLPESGIAWLVRVDEKGIEHVFGNLSPHANGDYLPSFNKDAPFDATGFAALQFYDQHWDAQGNELSVGGDGNMVIDGRDKIWSSLRLWFPKNCFDHRDTLCHALPGELVSLESRGLHSISLAAQGPGIPRADGKSWYRYDRVGNELKWWAWLNPKAADTATPGNPHCCGDHKISNDAQQRRIVDVYLKFVTPKGSNAAGGNITRNDPIWR